VDENQATPEVQGYAALACLLLGACADVLVVFVDAEKRGPCPA
jgi:hypothetical protein